MEDFLAQVNPYLIALVLAAAAKYAADAIVAVFNGGANLIIRGQKWLDERTFLKHARLDNLITTRLHEAILVVKDEYVDEVKAKSADGKLTKDEAIEATKMAYERFLQQLSSIERSELYAAFKTDLKRFAMAKIPALVQEYRPEWSEYVGGVIDSIEVGEVADPQ